MTTQKHTQEEIGSKIKQLRIEKKMTQAELAEKMNVSSSAVSKWERGLTGLDIHTACELADIFEISVSELTGKPSWDEENTEKQEGVEDTDTQQKTHKYKRLWMFMGGCLLLFILYFCFFSPVKEKDKDKFTADIVDEFRRETVGQWGDGPAYYIAVEYQGQLTDETVDFYAEEIKKKYRQQLDETGAIYVSFWEDYPGREYIEKSDSFCIIYPTWEE